MKSIKEFWNTLIHRWQNAMPRFFRNICWTCTLISGTALAVNTAITAGGGVTHEWWNDIYPYLLGIPAGMAFVAKFTQNYDRNGNPVNHNHKNMAPPFPCESAAVPKASALGQIVPEASASGQEDNEPFEIEPYDDRPNA